jgi:hypothetical protein
VACNTHWTYWDDCPACRHNDAQRELDRRADEAQRELRRLADEAEKAQKRLEAELQAAKKSAEQAQKSSEESARKLADEAWKLHQNQKHDSDVIRATSRYQLAYQQFVASPGLETARFLIAAEEEAIRLKILAPIGTNSSQIQTQPKVGRSPLVDQLITVSNFPDPRFAPTDVKTRAAIKIGLRDDTGLWCSEWPEDELWAMVEQFFRKVRDFSTNAQIRRDECLGRQEVVSHRIIRELAPAFAEKLQEEIDLVTDSLNKEAEQLLQLEPLVRDLSTEYGKASVRHTKDVEEQKKREKKEAEERSRDLHKAKTKRIARLRTFYFMAFVLLTLVNLSVGSSRLSTIKDELWGASAVSFLCFLVSVRIELRREWSAWKLFSERFWNPPKWIKPWYLEMIYVGVCLGISLVVYGLIAIVRQGVRAIRHAF